MPYLVDISLSYPKYYYSQKEIYEFIVKEWNSKLKNTKRVETIHENVEVAGRHLSIPIEEYTKLKNLEDKNKHFIEVATEIGSQSILNLCEKYDYSPNKIDSIWSNTVTGLSVPSIDARIANKIPLNENIKRIPMMGLGCMAGAAGLNRACEYLNSFPNESLLFLSVELCTLTYQMEDLSIENIISTGLFADGAAAVLLVGDKHPLATKAHLKWSASKSIFFKNTENIMGWDFRSTGHKIILSAGVPDLVRERIPTPVNSFLTYNGLKLEDIDCFFAHPGGPKVLRAIEEVLKLEQDELSYSWDCLKNKGNLSSVSVLYVIEKFIRNKQNNYKNALSIAMGPGFSAELGLFKWT